MPLNPRITNKLTAGVPPVCRARPVVMTDQSVGWNMYLLDCSGGIIATIAARDRAAALAIEQAINDGASWVQVGEAAS